MCMMRTFSSISALLLVAALPLTTAWAQQRLEWPRTFSGQPDFDFVRSDVVKERQQKAQDGEDVLATPGTWDALLPVKDINPLAPRQPKNGPGTKGFVGIELEPADQDLETLVGDTAETTELPTLATVATVDVSEFRSFLENMIDRAVRTAPPHFEEINIQAELSRISVQTISTSPLKYAMINGRRYTEGSTLNLPVYLLARTEDIVAAVDRQMPNTTQLGQQTQQTYQDIRDQVVKDFTENRNKRPNVYKAKHMLQITIEKIAPRRVTVSILGETYDLVLG